MLVTIESFTSLFNAPLSSANMLVIHKTTGTASVLVISLGHMLLSGCSAITQYNKVTIDSRPTYHMKKLILDRGRLQQVTLLVETASVGSGGYTSSQLT